MKVRRLKCVRGCPEGRPRLYILLPRSELNSASDVPYNWVVNLFPRTDGLMVQTLEMPAGHIVADTQAFFGFTSDLQPKNIAYGDNFRELTTAGRGTGLDQTSFRPLPGAPSSSHTQDRR